MCRPSLRKKATECLFCGTSKRYEHMYLRRREPKPSRRRSRFPLFHCIFVLNGPGRAGIKIIHQHLPCESPLCGIIKGWPGILGRTECRSGWTSGGIDRFRINSSLRISPLEQVEFLSKLVNETLPFDKGKVFIMIKRKKPTSHWGMDYRKR